METSSDTAEPSDRKPRQVPEWVRNTFGVVVALLILGMSGYLIAGGLHNRSLSEPIPGGIETTGTVIDVQTHHGRGTTYRAVIRFTDQDGKTHTFKGREGDEQPKVGDHGRVSYDQRRPESAHDLTFNHSSWKWPFWTGIVTTSFSLLVFVPVVVILVRQRRKAAAAGDGGSEPPFA